MTIREPEPNKYHEVNEFINMEIIELPKVGGLSQEGTIMCWNKLVGDAVQKNETLVLLETDKINLEIPSTASGVLRAIFVSEGETVSFGTIIALVGTTDEPLPDFMPGKPVEITQRCADKPPRGSHPASLRSMIWQGFMLAVLLLILVTTKQNWLITLTLCCGLIWFSFSLGMAFQKRQSQKGRSPDYNK